MAIDTAFKRRSSAASRRMPWQRRFGIAPDGTIGQRDRQQGIWIYGGLLVETNIPVIGIELELRIQRANALALSITRSIRQELRMNRSVNHSLGLQN